MKYIVELFENSEIENCEIEYKYLLETNENDQEKWAKTIVGYSNSFGGYIFVGVNNDGGIIGLDSKNLDNTKRLLYTNNDRHIFPHIELQLNDIYVDGKYILSIYIKPSNNIIIYKSGDFNEKVYIRKNGSTLVATASEIIALGKRKFGIDNNILNEQFTKNNYNDFFKLAKLYRKDHTIPTEQEMISKNIMSLDGRITEGLKMFSDNYNSNNTNIAMRVWNGYSKGVDEVLNKKEIKGNLCYLFNEAFNFIKLNTKSGFIKQPDGSRLDTKSYPDIAIREALINALAHRDYSINGTQIDIDIYKDRMEIMSPGGWLLNNDPSSYSLNSIPSIRRNSVVADCYEIIGLMEKSGSGFKKINECYLNYDNKKPELISNNDYFLITLFDLLYNENNDNYIYLDNNDIFNIILDYCYDEAKTRIEIQNHINMKSRSYFSTKYLKPLLENNLLIPTSKRTSTNQKYITNKNKYIKNH